MNRTYIAGVMSGVVGLLIFLVIHHVWIMPIWFILPMGLLIAAAGGAAVGWAYDELLPHLPPRPWTTLAVIALIWITLLPGIVLAELREPFFVLQADGGSVLVASVGRVTIGFIMELLVTAVIAGALAGWLIAGTRRAALATAVSGFIFALGPGHNIPLIGGSNLYYLGKELTIMMAIIVVSTLVLVEGHGMMSARGKRR